MALHGLVQSIVDAARQRHAGSGVDRLQPGNGVREHLQVDAGRVHFFQTQIAKIVEPADDVRPGTGAAVLPDLRIEVMLFERNDGGLVCHRFPPPFADTLTQAAAAE